MKCARFVTGTIVVLGLLLPAGAAEKMMPKMKMMKIIVKPNVETVRMGGVDVPSADVLKKMHAGQYILRARGGRLTEVPVQKTLLPHCNGMNPQGTQVDIGATGTVYVRMSQILCKSTDGGRTWSSRPIKEQKGVNLGWRWKVLRDGTFISVHCSMGKDARDPAVVWASKDEGRTWKKRAEIPVEMKLPQSGKDYVERYCHRGLGRLRDDTLLWVVDVRDAPYINGHGVFSFRSTDGGKTWEGPELIVDWGSEGANTLLPSGRILATMRYQRPPAPGDTPEIRRHMGTYPGKKGLDGFKNLFLMDSDDGGRTWSAPRMLTTGFGQTFGYPAAQSDGTVVVIHDTRYGPGPAGARAMISRDEGKTWEDEVYYLDHSKFTGSYSASVVLSDDTILTISGSSQAGNTWAAVSNKTDFYAIRWKPVKP